MATTATITATANDRENLLKDPFLFICFLLIERLSLAGYGEA